MNQTAATAQPAANATAPAARPRRSLPRNALPLVLLSIFVFSIGAYTQGRNGAFLSELSLNGLFATSTAAENGNSGKITFPSGPAIFVYDSSDHKLYYSPDGTTGHEVALATITNGSAIHATDIHVVA